MTRFLLALTLVVASVNATPAQSPLVSTLAQLSQDFYTTQRLPGLAVGVLVDSQVVYRAGFGTTRLGGGQPITPSTLFHMASITKPFVATAVVQLSNAGKVDLDAPVTRYVPHFRMKDSRASAITVRQLLTHTAGMPDVTDYRWSHPEYDEQSLERWIRGLADSALIAAPGERWQYSNIAFELLADLVARVSGESFENYVQNRILTPLAMRKSTLLMTDLDSSLMAWGHRRASPGAFAIAAHYPYNRRHAGSSTLHSNVDDMLRWARANLQRGALDGVRILPESAYDQLWKEQYDMLAAMRQVGGGRPGVERSGVGLSWFLETRGGTRYVSHGGGDTGFRTDLLLAPDQRVAVVVMTNSEAGPSQLSRALMEAVLADHSAVRQN
jgi:CubicO group peptidase (beta-lactamase class C family)